MRRMTWSYSMISPWNWDGTLDRIRRALDVESRERAEHEASPTACIIDNQSVKGAAKGGPCVDRHGFDAGKLIRGNGPEFGVRLGSGAVVTDCFPENTLIQFSTID